MTLSRWRRPQNLPLMFDEMDRAVDRYLKNPLLRVLEGEEFDFGPPIDVYETTDELTIKAELPGVEINDIDLTLEDERLILSGHTRQEHEVSEEGYHRKEIRTGSFRRAIPLPVTIKPEEVTATFDAGILTIRLPKEVTSASTRKIEVKQSG